MDKKTAEQINTFLVDCTGKLNESAMVVRNNCTEDEIESYLKPAGHAMAIIFDILDGIYKDHPNLKPDTW